MADKQYVDDIEIDGTVYYEKIMRPDPGGTYKKTIIAANRSVALIPDDISIAEAAGLKIYPANDTIPGPHIRPISRLDKETPKNFANVIDENGLPWGTTPETEGKRIGNGTKGTVLVAPLESMERGLLRGLMVTELVEYVRPEGEDDKPAMGYALHVARQQTAGVVEQEAPQDGDPNDKIPV